MTDKLDELYSALEADGVVSNGRENFRRKMLDPGEEGAATRKALYEALKADGAVTSPTQEEFEKRLDIAGAMGDASSESDGRGYLLDSMNDAAQDIVQNVTKSTGQTYKGRSSTFDDTMIGDALATAKDAAAIAGGAPHIVVDGQHGAWNVIHNGTGNTNGGTTTTTQQTEPTGLTEEEKDLAFMREANRSRGDISEETPQVQNNDGYRMPNIDKAWKAGYSQSWGKINGLFDGLNYEKKDVTADLDNAVNSRYDGMSDQAIESELQKLSKEYKAGEWTGDEDVLRAHIRRLQMNLIAHEYGYKSFEDMSSHRGEAEYEMYKYQPAFDQEWLATYKGGPGENPLINQGKEIVKKQLIEDTMNGVNRPEGYYQTLPFQDEKFAKRYASWALKRAKVLGGMSFADVFNNGIKSWESYIGAGLLESGAAEAMAQGAGYRDVGIAGGKYNTDFDAAAATAWNMAEDEYRRLENAHSNEIWGNYASMGGGREARIMASGEWAVSNMADNLTSHDLDKMIDNAWNTLGETKRKQIMLAAAQSLAKQYPGADPAEIVKTAQSMVRQQTIQRVLDYAKQQNAPKNVVDYFARKVLAQNSIFKIQEAMARSRAGTTGDWQAREMAMQEYGKNHRVAGVAGTVVGMGLDPVTYISAGVGKGAATGAVKLIEKGFGAAGRKWLTTTAGKVVTGAVGGAGNLGAFEGINEALEQLRWGGAQAVDLKTGLIKTTGYDAGKVGKAIFHGSTMGAGTGVVAPLVGNVWSPFMEATSSTAGKMGVKAGELFTGTIAEGTIFSIPDVYNAYTESENEIKSFSDKKSRNYIADEQERAKAIAKVREQRNEAMLDMWTESVATMAGFKAKHIAERLYEVSKSGNGRVGFETRLRYMLDRKPGLALTKDEQAELERGGYADLKGLVDEYVKAEKNRRANSKPATTGKPRPLELGTREEDMPYNRFVDLMNDGSISEAARAKMYYYITGHALPMSTVMYGHLAENRGRDGKVKGYTVQSIGANGVVTSREFTSRKRAENELQKINRQAELNTIDIGERYNDTEAEKKRFDAACRAFAAENNVPVSVVYERLSEGPKKSGSYYEQIAKIYKDMGDAYSTEQVRGEVEKRYNVDIQKILKKEPNRRTEVEQMALDEYMRRLFPESDFREEEAEEVAPGEQSTRKMGDRYLLGYNSQEGDGSRRASQEQLDTAEQRAIGELPPELMATLEEHPEQVGQIIANSGVELSESAQQAARDYAAARSEMDGVLQRVRDDIDAAVQQSDQLIDSRVHREDQGGDGMVRMAKLKLNDEEVYITSGKLAINRDGTIDYENSNKGIVVVGVDGEPRMVDIKEIVEINAPVDPAQLKQENADALRESMATAAADEIEGTLPFADGDEYQVIGDDNAAHVIRVINSNADGLTVNVTVDGDQEVLPMSKEQLQEWSDRVREQQLQPADDIEEENVDQEGVENKEDKVQSAAPETSTTPSVPETTSTGIVSDLNQPMPKTEDGKTDYSRVTPERAHHDIYNERGLSKERADKVVEAAIAKREAEVAEAQKAVEEARKALEKHQNKDIDVDNIDADLAEEQKLAEALRDAEDNEAKVQADVDYWRQVKAVEDARNAPAAPAEPAKITAPLSNEVNEFGKPFVLSSDGTTTFGEVDPESGLKAAPIKLSLGENTVDEEGRNHGYGLLHIEAGHGDQIRKAGFKSIEEFVETVAKNYETIREGGVVGKNKTYLLEISDGHNNTLFVQLSNDGSYWNINSAGIFREAYSRRKPIVASVPTIGNGSSTKSVEVNRGKTKGATTTSGNSSTTSEGKDNADVSNVQGNVENISEKNQSLLPRDVAERKERFPEEFVLSRGADRFTAYGDDAIRLGEVLGREVDRDPNYGPVLSFPKEEIDNIMPRLVREGLRVAVTDEVPEAGEIQEQRETITSTLPTEEEIKLRENQLPQENEVGDIVNAEGDIELDKPTLRTWVNYLPSLNKVKRHGYAVSIYDEEDLRTLKGIVSDELYEAVKKGLKSATQRGACDLDSGFIAIYTGKLKTAFETESTWWHENTHLAFEAIELADKKELGLAALAYVKKHDKSYKNFDDMMSNYRKDQLPGEGACRLIQYIYKNWGSQGIINGNFVGNEKIAKLATSIQNYLLYGETREEETENRLRQSTTNAEGELAEPRPRIRFDSEQGGQEVQPRGKRGNEKEVEGSRILKEEGNIVEPGHVELNVATMRDPESRRHLKEVMEKEGWSEGAQEEYFNMLEDVADVVIELGKQFPRLKEWNEREITSDKEGEEYNRRYRYYVRDKLMVNRPAFVKNGEYPWNIDLGTLCTKRESFDALVQIITEKGWGQNLGPTQIEAIKSLLRDNGFLTACDVCFNEARRARFLTFANDISFYWNSVRKAAGITDDKPVGEAREFTDEQERNLMQLAGRNYKSAYERLVPKELQRDAENDNGLTASMARRVAKMFLSAPSIAGVAEPEMFLGSANIDKLLRTYGPYTKLEGILKNAWGSGTPKPIEGFNLYDPLSWRDQYDNRQKRPVMDWFFNNGGMRAQSFTDYHPVMFFDYLQLFTDLAVRRLPIHIYTKVPALIKLFGKTGAKFNMSLVPEIVDGVDAEHAGLRPDGNGGWEYAWHEDSFPADEAFKLREDPNFKGNVGTIAVGVSREQILRMLDDPTIDMIIPFHGSGMPGAVKIKTGLDKATDYQDVQNTGGKPKKAKDFSFNEALRKLRNPRAAAEAYKEWCKKNGYTPKFEEFSEHPNYYKMLEDFTVVETLEDGTLVYHEQEPVVMRLPENWKETLTESLSDKTMQEGLKNQLLNNEELLSGLEKLLSKPRLDGDLRDVIMTSLERALGKGGAISLSESDFFKELENAYRLDVGQEEAKRKVEVLRDSQGIVYGFADGKRIVLNENHFNAETPMHEFTHIWGKVAQKVNPELWEEGKALLKQTDEWQEVMDDELYSDIHGDEDAVARETLARIEQKEMGEMAKDINDPSRKRPTKKGIYAKIREWLNRMFSNVRSLFAKSNRNLTYEELKKMPMKAVFDEAEAKRFQEAKKTIEDIGVAEKDVELEVSAQRPEDTGVSDEDLANYDAGGTPIAESISKGLMTLSERNRNNNEMRLRAISAFGGNLNNLEKLMSKQKAYDKSTVDDIIRLSRMVMNTGFFKDMSAYEVKRLLSAINKGVGAEDLMPIANNVIDVLVKHQLRESKELLRKLMKEKGSKVDSRGVEVQAGLDISGQRMMSALKDGMELDAEEIEARIADCEDRLDSADEVVKKNAMDEYQGLMLAKQWHDTIRASEKEDVGLRKEKRTAEERIYNFSRIPVVDDNGKVVMNQDGTMRTTERKALKPEFKNNVTDENKQLRKDTEAEIAAIEQLIRDNHIERVDAYTNLMSILAGDIKGSRERAAEWRKAQLQRVEDIHHNANSDLLGVDVKSQNKTPEGGLLAFNSNNDIVRLLFQPLATFEKMMRFFGRKAHNGEGYLFNRFMRGWVDCNDKEWRSKRAAHEELDTKVSEIMGKNLRWSDLFALERKKKYPTIPVQYWDNGELVQESISQGEALSLYMWNKMKDAKPGLRRMGISEEDIETIKGLIDPKFIELADWIQDEFLPGRRTYYNEVYERMFGAPMAAIADYFPIVRQKRDLPTNDDITQRGMQDVKASTVTGNIMKRVRTAATLDLHTDAFDLVLKHLDDMENWAAWAEFNRDINTLRNYKRFKNKVLNMNSFEFGSGKDLWDAFDKVCAIVAGVYGVGSDRGKADALAVNVAKGVTGAKIAFRIYTAAKQLLSLPAFWNGDANLVNSAKWFNPAGAVIAWGWAMKNLPGFSKRWQSRQAGDVRLKDTDSDYAFWRNNIIQHLSRGGMWANAVVDGITCAMGAHAVYDTKKARYLKDGYSEDQAEKRALQDAAISYNSSQQSSENAFVSPIQSDRTWQSTIFTVFRTASMGYQRRLTTGLRNLKARLKPGSKAESIEFMKKQMERDGVPGEKAEKAAKRIYRWGGLRSAADVFVFGFVLPFFWNLGPYALYLLFGDDDKKKDEMLKDAATHSAFGPIEGLTGGNAYSEMGNLVLGNMFNEDDKQNLGQLLKNRDFLSMPVSSDIKKLFGHLGKDNPAAWNDAFNILVQAGVGVNPETFTDVYAAIADYCDGDPETTKEFGLLLMRITQVPQSAIDNLYIDELGLKGKDAKKLNVLQLAERYARYKKLKNAPLMNWNYDSNESQEIMNKYRDRFLEDMQERVEKMDDEQLEQNFNNPSDSLRRNAVAKAYFKKDGMKDQAGKKPSSNWNPETRRYYLRYQGLRTWEDISEDKLVDTKLQQAKNRGDEKTVKKINSVKKEIAGIKKGLGKDDSKDPKIMERIGAKRKKLLEWLDKQ